MKTVADLRLGEKGIIDSFSDEELALKLMEMGCLPGVEILLKSKAPFGNPYLLQLSDSFLSLRKNEASVINIQS